MVARKCLLDGGLEILEQSEQASRKFWGCPALCINNGQLENAREANGREVCQNEEIPKKARAIPPRAWLLCATRHDGCMSTHSNCDELGHQPTKWPRE